MENRVFVAVLLTEFLHAGWNSVIKVGLDRVSTALLLALVQAVIALPILPFTQRPSAADHECRDRRARHHRTEGGQSRFHRRGHAVSGISSRISVRLSCRRASSRSFSAPRLHGRRRATGRLPAAIVLLCNHQRMIAGRSSPTYGYADRRSMLCSQR